MKGFKSSVYSHSLVYIWKGLPQVPQYWLVLLPSPSP